MRFLNTFAVIGFPVLSRADQCDDFCKLKLGEGAGCASFCKGANRVCHALYWTTESDSICIFGSPAPFGCTRQGLTPVGCDEAAAFIRVGAISAAAPDIPNLPLQKFPSARTVTTSTGAPKPVLVKSSSSQKLIEPAPPIKDAKPQSPAASFGDISRINSPSGQMYIFVSRLGQGACGQVFLARRDSDGENFAVKITAIGDVATDREVMSLGAVAGIPGFVQMVEQFTKGSHHYIVMGLLGRTIQGARAIGGGRFGPLPVNLVGAIGIQMVSRIQVLHSIGYVHLDLYPNNIAMGIGPMRERLVLIDFGEARPLVPGAEKTRRFDMRSIAHSVLQLLNPLTPYGDEKHTGNTPLELVCRDMPKAVLELFRYVYTRLGPDEEPDYDLMRSLLAQLAPAYDEKIRLE